MARIFFFNVVGLWTAVARRAFLMQNETLTIEEFASAGNAKAHKSAQKACRGCLIAAYFQDRRTLNGGKKTY